MGEAFRWDATGGAKIIDARLLGGSYAVVRCAVDTTPGLRGLHTSPARFGEAGGHASLACSDAVLFADEIEIDSDSALVRWNAL